MGDVWIARGKVVEAPDDPDAAAERTIDARGYVVMPGGVDVHCHIAGSKVNAARALRPEDQRANPLRRGPGLRSGTIGSVPSTFATGYQYAGLGYTTAVDAAIPPLGARHAHHELARHAVIDKAFLVLMGNNHFVMDRIRDGRARAGSATPSPGSWARPRVTASRWSTPAASSAGSRGGERRRARRRRSTHFGVTPRADPDRAGAGGRRARACRTRCTCTA